MLKQLSLRLTPFRKLETDPSKLQIVALDITEHSLDEVQLAINSAIVRGVNHVFTRANGKSYSLNPKRWRSIAVTTVVEVASD